MVIYAKDYTYYLSDKDISDFGKKITSEEVLRIPGDVFKVAFYKLTEKAKIKIENLGVKSGILNKVYKDPTWIEYIKAGIDKGTATESVQKIYNVSSYETAAFGDNLNDLGMLRRARISFAANIARPEVVSMCKFKTNNVNNEISNIIEKGDRYE
jgi:hydroxymethylpyrimidine pyrophosphatase-like HAD family hydrolase